MKRIPLILTSAVAALISSVWLVRWGMLSVIPLPVSDSMFEFALLFYRAQDQEESTNLLAGLGLLVWMPVTWLCWWVLLDIRRRRRAAAS